jgi:hypothetical protein
MIEPQKPLCALTVGEYIALNQYIFKEILKEQPGTQSNRPSQKEFYSPKEFVHLTGMKYSTVIYKCKMGKLKARQDDPSCSWQISASEVDRFKKEADQNI